jgi:Symplekin/PTA1 N-terminal
MYASDNSTFPHGYEHPVGPLNSCSDSFSQHFTTRRSPVMARLVRYQIKPPPAHGQLSYFHPNLLYQIHSEGGPSGNTRRDCGSKSMFSLNPKHRSPANDNQQRSETSETSLALVPRNHPLLNLVNLEAEASGLLDRLLSVFQDQTTYEPLLSLSTLFITNQAQGSHSH